MKVRLHLTLFIILLTLALICKQRLLNRSEIVQYLQNCILETILKSPDKISIRFMKMNYL